MKINLVWSRGLGIAGILGGLILFAGDMLFYYQSGSTDLLMNMATASNERIALSGVSALVASWLYLLGLGQVYYAFKPASVRVRTIVIISFAGILTAYGVVHAEYVAIAVTAKLAIQNQLDITTATELATYINDLLRLFVYPLFAVLSFVFISQVWKRKTLYPRWMLFFFPLLPFLLQGVFVKALSGDAWTIIIGGFLNLILVLFFTASTIALWNKKDD
ncbi:MAG: hypothetical protein COB12_00250 [Flavobacterium sp.]|nr:MAG: hypothetical protein COB12_00250 [Flavobacterium sp.]